MHLSQTPMDGPYSTVSRTPAVFVILINARLSVNQGVGRRYRAGDREIAVGSAIVRNGGISYAIR